MHGGAAAVDSPPQRAACLRSSTDSLIGLRKQLVAGPSEHATRVQKEKGKLTARERIALLFDDGEFHEIEGLRRHSFHGYGMEENRPYTDGVITGWGQVHGRTVFAYAHDFRVFGGSLGQAHAQKVQKVLDLAHEAKCPIVGLNDGAGARIQEGVEALAGFGGIFKRIVRNSGRIPQISVMLGPCAGGAAYAPALTDFIFMVRGVSQMFITGPDVIRQVTAEEVTSEELGGATVHTERSGVAAFAFDDEVSCLEEVRYLLSLLPSASTTPAPHYDSECSDQTHEAYADSGHQHGFRVRWIGLHDPAGHIRGG